MSSIEYNTYMWNFQSMEILHKTVWSFLLFQKVYFKRNKIQIISIIKAIAPSSSSESKTGYKNYFSSLQNIIIHIIVPRFMWCIHFK